MVQLLDGNLFVTISCKLTANNLQTTVLTKIGTDIEENVKECLLQIPKASRHFGPLVENSEEVIFTSFIKELEKGKRELEL